MGSVLGPLLFNLYINDLPNIANASVVHLYANDTLVYASSKDMNKAVSIINEELVHFNKYFCDNSLKINTQKTKVLVLGKNRPSISVTISF